MCWTVYQGPALDILTSHDYSTLIIFTYGGFSSIHNFPDIPRMSDGFSQNCLWANLAEAWKVSFLKVDLQTSKRSSSLGFMGLNLVLEVWPLNSSKFLKAAPIKTASSAESFHIIYAFLFYLFL